MAKIKYFLFLIICLFSCKNEIKFDSSKWNDKDDLGLYLYRKNMIDDIIENDLVKGKSFAELEKMFGTLEVDSLNNQKVIIQNIDIEYGLNIDPVSITDFIIFLNDNNKGINTKLVTEEK
jgi:hypothetical protein